MNRSRARSLDILDLDSVCGGATAAAPAAVMVRAGSLPSEVLKQLRGEIHDPAGDSLDPTGGVTHDPVGAPHAPTTAAPNAHAPAAAHNTGNDSNDSNDTNGSNDSNTGASHARGAHHTAPAHDTSGDQNEPAPRVASHPTSDNSADFPNGVPMPTPRPASADLPAFMQHDAENRANGYYGAFGDAPTGPSASSLQSFTQHDTDNRANGYYGAFGDAPTDAAHAINAMVPAPEYPTEAPHIDTTGVTPRYSDAELAQNRADTFSGFDDGAGTSAAPAAPAAPVHNDDIPTGPTMVASNDEDQSSTVV